MLFDDISPRAFSARWLRHYYAATLSCRFRFHDYCYAIIDELPLAIIFAMPCHAAIAAILFFAFRHELIAPLFCFRFC